MNIAIIIYITGIFGFACGSSYAMYNKFTTASIGSSNVDNMSIVKGSIYGFLFGGLLGFGWTIFCIAYLCGAI